jgi:hypothetical protein
MTANQRIDPRTGSFELWEEVVRSIVGEPTELLSLLDLCCNECTATSRLGCQHHVAIDLVDWPTRVGTPLFVKDDALLYAQTSNSGSFDLCICSDGIEHLTREDGRKLLREMDRVVGGGTAIIFTPLGPYMLDPTAIHPDAHKSAWTPAELGELGWNTITFPNWHPALGIGAFFAFRGNIR